MLSPTAIRELFMAIPTRTISDHKVNPANDVIEIRVMDKPGTGGANHEYDIHVPGVEVLRIGFQDGPIADDGVNGITQEALLAIVADRLQGFQSGPFACRENALALTKVQEAMHWLHHRTRERMDRGVEGTHQP